MLKLQNISHKGTPGRFRANTESLGWQSTDGEEMVVQSASAVKKAEWFDGSLRLLVEKEDGSGTEVLALDGFSATDFDAVWKYFEQINVYVKKHKAVAALEEADFDAAMRGIEDAADKVDEAAQGSVPKKAREADLMIKVEGVRDGLEQAISGDKQALSRVFSANGCERIGRMRLVIDTVQLEGAFKKDPRWKHLKGQCATIEAVLKELGAFRAWRPAESGDDKSMMRRMMVKELRVRNGENIEEDEEEEEEVAPPRRPAPNPLGGGYGGLAANPLLANPLAMPIHMGPPPAVVPQKVEPPVEPEPVKEPEPPAPVPAASTKGPTPRPGAAGREDDDDDPDDIEVSNPNAISAKPPSRPGEDHKRHRYRHEGSLLEGWVWKRSRFLKKWRRRWLVLMPTTLMTFKQPNSTAPTESVDKGTVQRVYDSDQETQQTKCFCVTAGAKRTFSGPRSYYMVCDDESEKREWIREITKALGGIS